MYISCKSTFSTAKVYLFGIIQDWKFIKTCISFNITLMKSFAFIIIEKILLFFIKEFINQDTNKVILL